MSTPTVLHDWKRWASAHRGYAKVRNSVRPYKIVHRTRLGAWWHIVRLHLKYGRDGHVLNAYVCTWTDDYRQGQVGRRHWHVGRRYKWGA